MKFIHKGLVPVVQMFGSVLPKSLPNDPLEIVYPMFGEIDQTNFGLVLQLVELPLFSNAPIDVLVIQICVFVHPLMGIVKLAIGGVET